MDEQLLIAQIESKSRFQTFDRLKILYEGDVVRELMVLCVYIDDDFVLLLAAEQRDLIEKLTQDNIIRVMDDLTLSSKMNYFRNDFLEKYFLGEIENRYFVIDLKKATAEEMKEGLTDVVKKLNL